MPTYSYQCPSCSHRFSLEQSVEASEGLSFCPRCWTPAKRSWQQDLSTVSIQTKVWEKEVEKKKTDEPPAKHPTACEHHHHHTVGSQCALSVDWDKRARELGC